MTKSRARAAAILPHGPRRSSSKLREMALPPNPTNHGAADCWRCCSTLRTSANTSTNASVCVQVPEHRCGKYINQSAVKVQQVNPYEAHIAARALHPAETLAFLNTSLLFLLMKLSVLLDGCPPSGVTGAPDSLNANACLWRS